MIDAPLEGLPPQKDRATGLIIFGMLQLALGGICALFTLVMVTMLLVTASTHVGGPTEVRPVQFIPGTLIYACAAAWFGTMGIGSIRARRWARALTLVSSWMWLLCGTIGMVGALFFVPPLYASMAQKGAFPVEFANTMSVLAVVFVFLFGVLMPLGLVLFYRSPHVKATCEFLDPSPRWTDACPLPVLGASLWLGFVALSTLSTGAYGWIVPFFGAIFHGWAGAGVAISTAIASLYAARGMRRLQLGAWWMGVALVIFWGVSACVTFANHDIGDYYQYMQIPEEQMKQYKDLALPGMSKFVLLWAPLYAMLIGYFIYLRRYFVRPASA